MHRQGTFAPMLLIFAACGGDADRPQITERDSAGIRIVEHPADYRAPTWRVASAPQLDIGEAAGDSTTLLYQVEGALRLSDGRIVVANRSSHELLFYDASGNHLFSSGREGEGPGEFGYLTWMMSCGGDSIITYDIATRRLSVFDERGEYVRGVMLQLPDGVTPYGVGTCAPDGVILIGGWPEFDPTEGPSRPARPLALVRSDGTALANLGAFSGGERYTYYRDGRLAGSGPRPLGRETYHVLAGDRFYLGTSDTYEIAVYSRDGTLEGLIRRARSDLALTEDIANAYAASDLAGARTENARRSRASYYRDMEWPETLPAYGRFLLDAGGNLWVEAFLRPGQTQPSWSVFGPDGWQIATIETPPGFHIYEIGEDYILGKWSDDLDVERVRMYALLKAEG